MLNSIFWVFRHILKKIDFWIKNIKSNKKENLNLKNKILKEINVNEIMEEIKKIQKKIDDSKFFGMVKKLK